MAKRVKSDDLKNIMAYFAKVEPHRNIFAGPFVLSWVCDLCWRTFVVNWVAQCFDVDVSPGSVTTKFPHNWGWQ